MHYILPTKTTDNADHTNNALTQQFRHVNLHWSCLLKRGIIEQGFNFACAPFVRDVFFSVGRVAGRYFLAVLLLLLLLLLGGGAFFSFPLMGGAAWPPPSFGGVAFAPLHWVLLFFLLPPHPKEAKENRTTLRKKGRKAPLPQEEEGGKHHLRGEKRKKSTTQMRRGENVAPTRKGTDGQEPHPKAGKEKLRQCRTLSTS